MSERGRRALLSAYPRRWRERYADEVLVLLDDEHADARLGAGASVDLVVGGLTERARGWFDARSKGATSAAEAGLSLLAWGWCLVALGGIALAKQAEHFDARPASHAGVLGGLRGATTAFDVVQWCAAVAALGMVALAACALLVAVRTARRDELGALRSRAWVASAAVLVGVGFLVAAAATARALPAGGVGPAGQGAWVLGAAAAGVVVLATLTRVLVAALALVTPPRGLAAALTVLVASAVSLLSVATVAWWVAVATSEPGFLAAAARGSSPLTDGRTVMAVATAALVAGSALCALGARRSTSRRGRLEGAPAS